MVDEKKYKYTVKKFAKMLTVHPDKRVTFQDVIDLRNFISLAPADFFGGPWHDSLQQFVLNAISPAGNLTRGEETYWNNIVEHGNVFLSGNIPVRSVSPHSANHILVEFEVPAQLLAEWLAETGFPQLSRAKEEPDAKPDVAQ
jgi:hypothetical protein